MAVKKKTSKEAAGGPLNDRAQKLKALGVTMEHLEKDFGSGAVMCLGDDKIQNVEAISTGSLGLDYALGVGGVPRGRITEIYGPESSGKTTLAIHVIAEAQKAGGICAIIDAEHAFDRFYAEQLGVDVNSLWIAQPDNGEQALDIAEQLINSGAIDVLVVDSVAALTPKAEIEGEMGQSHVGLQARLMSQALRKLTAISSRTKTCIIFINQLREKVGIMFGNPEVTPGGKALKFYASIRLDVRKKEAFKNGTEVAGNKTTVKVVKNKLAPPFKVAEFDIVFGKGISQSSCLVDLALKFGLMTKSGSWFNYKGERFAQGREGAKKVLEENKQLASELEAEIRKAAGEKSDLLMTGDDEETESEE